MAEFKVRTKGGATSQGKPRVYFTCHPDDFEKYFDKICEDVFKTHDCAIYYTEDMNEPLDDTNITVDLTKMNLYLVPITFRLMSEDNRAMAVDIAFAKENNIPILPFMMESGLSEIYSLPNNFGQKQYLSPFKTDLTAISYEEKLNKFLESILISDEMANRVRAAFDAYIFLSYRKKDRKYANELMRIIHNIPSCRDIAVWYDEFLAPGESFIENIEKAMDRSKLFTLLVTPNLLEDGNFVITDEYPMARKANMDILPTEMEETDRAELSAKFDGIPEPIKAEDEHFAQMLLSVIEKIAKSENDADPEHNFLIGLAYLDGIDVETDVERGLALITSAAEAEVPEAMEMMYSMYTNGNYVAFDFYEALKWAEKLANYCVKEYGEKDLKTFNAYDKLIATYREICLYQEALELNEKVYINCKEMFGEEDPNTLLFMSNLSILYSHFGNYEQALEISKKSYEIRRRILGEKHIDTLTSLNNLACSYRSVKDFKNAFKLSKKVYELMCEIYGEKHPYAIFSLSNLAGVYSSYDVSVHAIEMHEQAYKLTKDAFGELHPLTIRTLENLAFANKDLEEHDEAFTLFEKLYVLRAKVFGENHPQTIMSMYHLAEACDAIGELEKEIELLDYLSDIFVEVYGAKHPLTIKILMSLALAFFNLEEFYWSYVYYDMVYNFLHDSEGEDHPDVVNAKEHMRYIESFMS